MRTRARIIVLALTATLVATGLAAATTPAASAAKTQGVSAGGGHDCALTSGGDMKCWGLNDYGQLGDGTDVFRTTPVKVKGLKKVEAITAGYRHTCAIEKSGTAKCWGANEGPDGGGQLGDGSDVSRKTPVKVKGLKKVKAITAGLFHTCAIESSGTVKCWGRNDDGQLGDGAPGLAPRLTPVKVKGLKKAKAITAGAYHTCAIENSGTVKCWGVNYQGEVGDGTAGNIRATPVKVKELKKVTAIDAGRSHTCAIEKDGTAKCWGLNHRGQLGEGLEAIVRTKAVKVKKLKAAKAIDAGSSHTCAVEKAKGVAKCWGAGGNGQLGDGIIDPDPLYEHFYSMPVKVKKLGAVTTISAGGGSCAIEKDGTLKCWGWRANGGFPAKVKL